MEPQPPTHMQGLSAGAGGAVSLFSLSSGTSRPGLSPPPTFSPTSPLTYSPCPKIPFTLLTPVFNLSPPATSTVCSLGNMMTRLPSLLVSPQRKAGRKGPGLNEHSVQPQAGAVSNPISGPAQLRGISQGAKPWGARPTLRLSGAGFPADLLIPSSCL